MVEKKLIVKDWKTAWIFSTSWWIHVTQFKIMFLIDSFNANNFSCKINWRPRNLHWALKTGRNFLKLKKKWNRVFHFSLIRIYTFGPKCVKKSWSDPMDTLKRVFLKNVKVSRKYSDINRWRLFTQEISAIIIIIIFI